MSLSLEQILLFLYIVVGLMLIFVLYQVMFTAAHLRRILRRFDDLSEEIAAIVMKPVSVADQLMDFVMDFVKKKQAEMEQKKVHKRKVVDSDDE